MRPDEGATLVLKQVEEQIPHRHLGAVVVTATDDFSAEQPHRVAVASQGFIGESLDQQVDQEGFERLDDAFAPRDILFLDPPRLWPVPQVRAVLFEGGGHRVGWDNWRLIDFPTLARHATDPFAQCLSSFPRFCLCWGAVVRGRKDHRD